MTLKLMESAILLRIKQYDPDLSISRKTVRVLLNEALQYAYEFALRTDYTFYIRREAFTAQTSVTYPSNFRDVVFVEIPDATDGYAVEASNREYLTVNQNEYSMGDASLPVFTKTDSAILITPESTGTLYYIWSFGYQDEDETELTTLVPWIYDEVVILKTMEIARIRKNLIPILDPSEISRQLQSAEEAITSLNKAWTPLALFQRESPAPV